MKSYVPVENHLFFFKLKFNLMKFSKFILIAGMLFSLIIYSCVKDESKVDSDNSTQIRSLQNSNQDIQAQESLQLCAFDSNSIKITILPGGLMQIELLNGSAWNTITWSLSTGGTFSGNPIKVPCNKDGFVTVSAFSNSEPQYKCIGKKFFKCKCCPTGFTYDGANCYSGVHWPSGYQGFVWNGGFYVKRNCSISTANNCCPPNFVFDGANCHYPLLYVPEGYTGFVLGNSFYVKYKEGACK